MVEMQSEANEAKRFYVGNLFEGIRDEELSHLFSRFGKVTSVEKKHKRDIDGNITATFAFVSLAGMDDDSVANCVRQCNHLKWKKQIIRVQLAQDSFLQRLSKERQQSVPAAVPAPNTPTDYDPMRLFKSGVQSTGTSKKRYYSSSDEDMDEEEKVPQLGSAMLTKLENFNTDFWQRDDQASSNEKRLASLKNRQQQLHVQKAVIQNALKSLKTDKAVEPVVHKMEENCKTQVRPLFHEEEQDENDEHDDHFRIRPQFEGEKGKKLLALQSRVAFQDARFKMDGRFADDDDDDDDDEPLPEKSRATSTQSKGIFKDVSKLRFDPEDEAQQQQQQLVVPTRAEPETGPRKLSAPTDTKPPRNKYWVSETLAKALKSEASSGFSLLSAFGTNHPDAGGLAQTAGPNAGVSESGSGRKPWLGKNPFRYESSSESEGEDNEGMKTEEDDVARKANLFGLKLREKALAQISCEPFFFRPNDGRFQEAVTFLALPQEMEQLRSQLDQKRPVLSSIMKKKLKRTVQKQQVFGMGPKQRLLAKRGRFRRRKNK